MRLAVLPGLLKAFARLPELGACQLAPKMPPTKLRRFAWSFSSFKVIEDPGGFRPVVDVRADLAELGNRVKPLIATTPDIKRWSTLRATVVHCRLPAWEAGSYASLSNGSSIGLSFTSQRCVVEVAGRARDRRVPAAGVVIIGSEPTQWLRVDEPSELIEITADQSLRSSVAEELFVPGARDLASISLDNDPRVWAIGVQLRALVRGTRAGNELEIDALTRLLYGHILVRQFGGRLRARGSGALDNRRLERVIDHVEAHLEDALGLAVLAEVAALSPFHFQRSFFRATGCTPHRYVAVRRAQRAVQWLKEGRSVHEVARVLRYGSTARLRMALQRVE